MRVIGTLVCMGALAAALACGSGEESAPAQPTGSQSAAPGAPAEPAAPAAEPEPAPAQQAAAGGPGSGDAAEGAAHYKMYCATCHGETGCGDGPLSAGLDPKPVKHCDGNYMNTLSDEYLFQVVKEGGAAVGKSPLMAAWGGSLSDEQIWDVVAYMRSIADPPYRAKGG